MTTMSVNPAMRPYPRGVRPHFFDAAERRRSLEEAVFSRLRTARYREVILPVIDASEPYREIVDEATRRRSYRFIDREGELLEIRSDFTPMVARSLAPMLDVMDLPLRVSYRGDVVRCESGRLSDDGEFYQIGAELLGIEGAAGDGELLALAVAASRSVTIEPSIVVSNEGLIEVVVAEAPRGVRARLRRAVAEKRLDEVERLADGMGRKRRDLLLSICSGTARADELREGGLAEVVDEMERARGSIPDVDVRFAYDDIDPIPSYYTGIRFKMFDASGRVEIGRGGRYDDLYGKFGSNVSAVGFTVSLDRMESLL